MQIFILHILCHNIFSKKISLSFINVIYIHTKIPIWILSPPVMGLATELEMITQAFKWASGAQVR